MQSESAYYTGQGPISHPGEMVGLYQDLPTRVDELVRIVQGTTIHVFWAKRYGVDLSDERQAEVQLRQMPRRLARTLELDPRPLTEPRAVEQKLVGNCRDHSLLLVSMLRHQGIPARARCGFGVYFQPNHYEDHWVGEYWNADEKRWVMVDAQLDALQCEALQIPFNPLDVPRDQFIVGGKAWQMARSGQADPDSFGIFEMRGLGFILGNLLRDLAALNRMELLPWDCWGLMLKERLDDGDFALLDEAAALTAADAPDFEKVRRMYTSQPGLCMDGTLLSYVAGQMIPVEIAGAAEAG
ncbi:MAG TPA: transglutaminase-like domain-containing protein [Anaerolineaceae bacterium]